LKDLFARDIYLNNEEILFVLASEDGILSEAKNLDEISLRWGNLMVNS